MNEGEEIRFIDLFSGIGGFRLGLEKANTRMEKDSVENNFAKRSCTKPQTISTRKEERTGHFRCVWSCDNNKYANQVYTKQFGEANHHPGDIRGVDPREIPDFDLLCAGFPCQSFSVAGKRRGFQDTRGTLFFEISRIAEAKRPEMLLLENVKGLLSSDRGQTFQTILQELGRIGYWAEWQILNSKHHGVPQNRERVFIIGHLRGTGGREIFPIGETDEMAKKDGRGRPPVQAEVSTAIDGSYYKGVVRHGQRTVVLDTFNRGAKEEESYSLKTNPSSTSSAVVDLRQVGTLGKDDQASRVYSTDGLSPTIPTPGGGHHMPKIAISFTNPHDSKEDRKLNLSDTSRAIKPPYGNQQPLILADRTRTLAGLGRNLESPKPITNALSGVQKDNLLLKNMRIRRLTPVECERLQGFPDGWTEYGYVKDAILDYEPIYGWKEKYNEELEEWEEFWTVIGKNPIDPIENTVRISDTQRYKCLGNAVTTNVVTFLGKRIMEAEK